MIISFLVFLGGVFILTEENENTYVTTQLSLPPSIRVSKYQMNIYKILHEKLPKMKKNRFNIYGAEIKIVNKKKIIVTAFIRNTVPKDLRLNPAVVILLDEQMEPFAKVKVGFSKLGALPPNTARPWTIEFPEDSFLQEYTNKLNKWSLAFEKNITHQVDYSDMDESKISEKVKNQLTEIIEKAPLDKGEISFMGLTAKFDDANNIVTTILIRNGTDQNIEVKQLPLKLFDATGVLSAKGTFKLENLNVMSNTSKPISLLFPNSSILKPDMDLTKWRIEHNE